MVCHDGSFVEGGEGFDDFLGAGGGFKGVRFVRAEDFGNVFPIFERGGEGNSLVVRVSFCVLEFSDSAFQFLGTVGSWEYLAELGEGTTLFLVIVE